MTFALIKVTTIYDLIQMQQKLIVKQTVLILQLLNNLNMKCLIILL